MTTLKKVNEKNVWELLKLTVDDSQRNFVATNTESIVEAYTAVAAGGIAVPFGIYEDETPVGFLMIGYGNIPYEGQPSVAMGNYCIWRLMIDRRYQNQGIGRRALTLALDYIRTLPCGAAELCYLSYEPENTVAAELYHSFGFEENGEYDGDEMIAVLKL